MVRANRAARGYRAARGRTYKHMTIKGSLLSQEIIPATTETDPLLAMACAEVMPSVGLRKVAMGVREATAAVVVQEVVGVKAAMLRLGPKLMPPYTPC